VNASAPRHILTEENAIDYLRAEGRLPLAAPAEARFLAGGVSNVVLYIRRLDDPTLDFVLKQASPQLRVPQPWFCSVERIWREVAVLRLCERLLYDAPAPNEQASERLGTSTASRRSIHLPRLLFEDRDNYAFAMTAAPLGHSTWKQRLLDGDADVEIADACGRLLGRLHATTWLDSSVAAELDDRQFFDDLRLDPYYRQVARVHSSLAPIMERLVASVWDHRRSLVHGDFSPKNLLVWPDGLMLIDCEVGHYGDPAFDLGFFLTHLVLKSLTFVERWHDYFRLPQRFWASYAEVVSPAIGATEWQDLERLAQWNLAGCMLARIDGKSRVEYLRTPDEIRKLAIDLLQTPATTWRETCERLEATSRLLRDAM